MMNGKRSYPFNANKGGAKRPALPVRGPWMRQPTRPNPPPTPNPPHAPTLFSIADLRSDVFMFRDFPLTKNGSKAIRIGLDVKTLVPTVSLIGQIASPIRQTASPIRCAQVKLSLDDLHQLLDDAVYLPILEALQTGTDTPPISLGELKLHCGATASYAFVSLEGAEGHTIRLGLSSWEWLKHSAGVMDMFVQECTQHSMETRYNVTPMLTECANTVAQRAAGPVHAMPEAERDALMREAILTSSYPFSFKVKQELLCYHFDHLKDSLLSLIPS